MVFLDHDVVSYNDLTEDEFHNFVFHIGMVELISYWKLACPPVVKVVPHHLTEAQILWWKKLYFHGLGEFFYLNGIEEDMDGFMHIETGSASIQRSRRILNDNQILIPIGGGKDSAVSLELMKNKGFRIYPTMINPREASQRTIEAAGFKMGDSLICTRKLDPLLLKLNTHGFLNGHTPFSSLLAFVTAFMALSSKSKYIGLSNENSANQSTVPGTKINHQYSKSFEFELDFNSYVKQYLHPDLKYFSLLRPLSELQIAGLFSKIPWHFSGFRSCNVGSKADGWCGKCPKCLFTYIILAPFLSKEDLLSIFGSDLLNSKELQPIFDELSGRLDVKPFECVGTPEEVKLALWKYATNTGENPDLLSGLQKEFDDCEFSRSFKLAMLAFNEEHLLEKRFVDIIKEKIDA